VKLCDLGERPPLGVVPEEMHAFVVRPERYGEPRDAFRHEVIPTPALAADEVLVYVMATGINYNNVWAALGRPVDVVAERQRRGEPEAFHAGGSDCSGIVWQVGEAVTRVQPGDEVVVHGASWEAGDPWVLGGGDPVLAETTRVWGYQTNYGSFCQFARAQAHQCLPKPERLTWEEAGCFLMTAGTAYRMLMGWPPNVVRPGDAVLVWGAAGGLGAMGLQIAAALGGRPVAVVSSDAKRQFCLDHGAAGVIDRTRFSHWGVMPDTASAAYGDWLKGARAFGKALWDALGDRVNPALVFEHPGQDTLPTSAFVAATGGMIVICAGTTGYNVTLDLRYHWMRQKRFQGSHLMNDEQAAAATQMVAEGKISPALSQVFPFEGIPEAHQLMRENRHPAGNMACLVNALRPGEGAR
jgi:crotonyl-CoA carboxylase/reductase